MKRKVVSVVVRDMAAQQLVAGDTEAASVWMWVHSRPAGGWGCWWLVVGEGGAADLVEKAHKCKGVKDEQG